MIQNQQQQEIIEDYPSSEEQHLRLNETRGDLNEDNSALFASSPSQVDVLPPVLSRIRLTVSFRNEQFKALGYSLLSELSGGVYKTKHSNIIVEVLTDFNFNNKLGELLGLGFVRLRF